MLKPSAFFPNSTSRNLKNLRQATVLLSSEETEQSLTELSGHPTGRPTHPCPFTQASKLKQDYQTLKENIQHDKQNQKQRGTRERIGKKKNLRNKSIVFMKQE